MLEFIINWATQAIKYVPTVTWVGLLTAGVLMITYLTKRWRECALLAGVCVAYGLSPYLPVW